MYLKNFQLQDQCDWVLVIENMNISRTVFGTCEAVKGQLQSCEEAIELLMSMFLDSAEKDSDDDCELPEMEYSFSEGYLCSAY